MQVEKVNLAANPGAEPDKSQERIIADIFAFIFEGATPTEGATLAEGAPLAEGATPTEGAPLAEGAPIAEGAPLTEYPYITVISRGALFDSVDHLEGVEICLCVFFILFYCLLTQSVKAHTTGRRIVVEQTARRVLPLDVAHDIVDIVILIAAGNCVGGNLIRAEKEECNSLSKFAISAIRSGDCWAILRISRWFAITHGQHPTRLYPIV